MSAQPEHPAPGRRVPIPHTGRAIGDALSAEKRLAFYAELLAAEAGAPINAVLRKWWMEAMFDAVPGRARRLANADEGRNLVPLPDLAGGQGE
ncbi:hypothetical protein [Streptomyces sp. DW26H14]|uniref:hypothetical protein n=1 Tax=Streptomyces sp. DW26H14 TaxID=3435395 RepID=UPI00403E16E1